MKKRIVLGFCTAVAVIVLSTTYVNKLNDVTSVDKPMNVAFSESRFSQDELIEKSDIIVRCAFIGKTKTEIKTAYTSGSDGKEFTITSPVTEYSMKLVENLKGIANNEFKIGLIGGTNKNFENGVEYVLFLDKSDTDGGYKLVSYNQGFNKAKYKDDGTSNSIEQPIEIESVTTKEVINYKELIANIK